MRIIPRFRLVIAVLSLFYGTVQAEVKNLNFEQLSTEHGLSNSTVYSIAQDNNGFMWFGTTNGLNKYDGHRFTVFKNIPGDSTSLSSDNTGNIMVARNGIIWIGSWGGGLNRFDPSTFQIKHYLPAKDNSRSLSEARVQSLFEDSKGRIWAGTYSGGLNMLVPGDESFDLYSHIPGNNNSISHNRIWTIAEDNNEHIWVGTSDGLNCINPETGFIKKYFFEAGNPNSIPSNVVRSIIKSRNGLLWIGTQNGFCSLNPETDEIRRYLFSSSVSNQYNKNTINHMCELDGGEIWIGSGNGLIVFDPKSGTHQRYLSDRDIDESLSDNEVRWIYQDNLGIVWLGTRRRGINKYTPQKKMFNQFLWYDSSRKGYKNQTILAVHAKSFHQKKYLWIATLEGLYEVDMRSGQIIHSFYSEKNPDAIYNNSIRVVAPSVNPDILWLGILNGVIRYNCRKKQFHKYSLESDINSKNRFSWIISLYEGKNDLLWAGDLTGGLLKLDSKSGRLIQQYKNETDNNKSLAHNEVWMIHPNKSKGLWVGHGRGLDYFDFEKEQFSRCQFTKDGKGAQPGRVFSCYQDLTGNYWFGSDQGLLQYNVQQDSFLLFNQGDGLADNRVVSIQGDKNNNLWIGTDNGLSWYNQKAQKFTNFSIDDGLLNPEYLAAVSCGFEDGTLYFGGKKGLDYFHPDSIKKQSAIPPVVFTDLKILNKSIKPEKNGILNTIITDTEVIALNYSDYLVSIEFASLYFNNPLKIKYAYMLEGIDESWIYTDALSRSATYTNLPGGNYLFKVKARLGNDPWSDTVTSLSLKIIPPFWDSRWFKWLAAIFLVLSFITVYRIRTRAIKKQNSFLEALNSSLNEEIKERKKIEQSKERLQGQLIQSQKIEAIGTLAGGIAHDFNNILTIINGHAELGMLNSGENERVYRDFDSIYKGGQRAADLTRQLLAFSRKQVFEPKIVSINTVVTDLERMLRRLIDEDIQIIKKLSDDIPLIKADPRQLEQILMNLLINSRDAIKDKKFFNEEKIIYIKTERLISGTIPLHLKSEDKHHLYAKITIEDNGKGMDNNTKVKVFDPFFTTKEQGKGTGLGLSTVYGIIKQNDGYIEVESTPDKGTSFYIYWPVTDEDKDDISQGKPFEFKKAKGEKILVVEDDPEVRTFAVNALTSIGYQVSEAGDGQEALILIMDGETTFDLIVTDLIMPNMSGQDLAERLKESHPQVKILFTSGYTDNLLGDSGELFEGINFIHKPYSLQQLSEKIRLVLES